MHFICLCSVIGYYSELKSLRLVPFRLLLLDTTDPTMTISAVNGSASGSSSDDASINLKFETNEVTDSFTDSGAVTVQNGCSLSALVPSTTIGEQRKVFTATLSPPTVGTAVTCVVTVPASTFTDSAGNQNEVSNSFTWSHTAGTRDSHSPLR